MMRIAYLFLLTNILSFQSVAQKLLSPTDPAFDKKRLRTGISEMSYYSMNGSERRKICTFLIDVRNADNKISIYTTLAFMNSQERWLDTCIMDGNLKPQYRSSYRSDSEYAFRYGSKITGTHYDKKTQRKTAISEVLDKPVFDNYAYPYLLGLLPLQSGYKANLLVYEYKPGVTGSIKQTQIREVKSNQHQSSLTGNHAVWQVSVWEESSGDQYQYYIDKETYRLWKIEIRSGNSNLLLVDNEIDFNPVKSKFDKAATMNMITNGTSTIAGSAFARDNENEGLLKGMAVLNVNKKQHAPPGTTIVLIPYTDYFKEWMKLNKASRKKGLQIPLLEDAASCMKVTTVYDEEGHFEFVNLMPGEYLLYTEFAYVHTTTRSEVVGYTDTYINGLFQGSSENTQTYQYGVNASASIQEIVTIETPGEKVNVKLKKTR